MTASATFDLFCLLPCELRLQIWQHAIRPDGRGLHRFSLFNTKTDKYQGLKDLAISNAGKRSRRARHEAAAPRAPPNTHDHQRHQQQLHSWTRGNSSAYLWDAGLWTACRESREVMMWHFRVRDCNQARHKALRGPGFWSPSALAEELQDAPTMMLARENGVEWQFMVRPHRDLFCLEPQDWKSTVTWSSLFLDLPFASRRHGFGHLSNIAVEFDPSWNLNLPKDVGVLPEEQTPRGFVARAMAECAKNNLYCSIWLIDRTIARPRPDPSDHEYPFLVQFYDCERTYVSTELEDLEPARYYESGHEFQKTAIYFLDALAGMDCAKMDNGNGPWGAFDFWVGDYLGVLACI
ncbi:hypothetical protein HIM_10677 [Hirsutella minnesotensis 3608]|uniref:2EXR domain-containing protein n=1 Tax=Hirsutella minnesotensis 3608 TaxID=1043627 RepID=A0A0F7ZFX9_9HYPO|nr:hypothetical protein HIM_10677 [Hirsutella minnesotensis 3608]